MRIETELAHAGLCSDKTTGAVSTPIYQTATFVHPALGESTGFDYSRTKNPTRLVLEQCMASLEKGDMGFAFSSGMAAITAIITIFNPGDHLVVSDDLYGGTYRLFEKIFTQKGINFSWVDTSCLDLIEKAININTKAIFVETPTNPMMKITDIKASASFLHNKGILLIVDNTFMTPFWQRPIECGADIVVHSGSKYLGGHNDLLSGIVVTAFKELSDTLGFIQNSTGGVLSPMDSWLLLRGLKTLSLRLERSQENAFKIAESLLNHKQVTQVYFPGLSSHTGYAVHKSQASGAGAMISFRVKDRETAEKIINSVKVISFAESLGGVESLITYPILQTHADIPEETRNKIGITDDLLRLSVGIENCNDLTGDLYQALD